MQTRPKRRHRSRESMTQQKLDSRKRQAERFRRVARALELEQSRALGLEQAWRRWQDDEALAEVAGGR